MADPTQPNETAVLNVRLPKDVKDRLAYHAAKQPNASPSSLARHAIGTLVKILDQKELQP